MKKPPSLRPAVAAHPAGGFTLAWPLTGTARVYTGTYPTRRSANSAVSAAIRRGTVQRVRDNLHTIED